MERADNKRVPLNCLEGEVEVRQWDDAVGRGVELDYNADLQDWSDIGIENLDENQINNNDPCLATQMNDDANLKNQVNCANAGNGDHGIVQGHQAAPCEGPQVQFTFEAQSVAESGRANLGQVLHILNEEDLAGSSSKTSSGKNMLGRDVNVEEDHEQLLFDETTAKDLGFPLNSQDLDLNVNSQDLLRYGEIGNLSDTDDVLNRIFGEPVGMDYILALKSGVDSRSNSTILFNESPCFTNYGGSYGFDVTPAADGKKCIYEPSLNKIYLTPGTFEFKVKLNWNELSYDANANLLLRTQVDFTDPGYCQVPVKKCMNCMASQQKLADQEDHEGLEHVVRTPYTDNDTVYFKSDKTSKLYIYQRVGSPELGCTTISKRLVFTCMNSCKSGSDGGGINRREVALVFTLLNKMHQAIGRRVFILRICTAPHRDVKIDLDPKAKAKKRRLGQGKTPQAKRSRKSYLIDLPGPSSGVSVPVVRQQDNNVSSSQETCYSGDEDEVPQRDGLLLRTLIKNSREILRWKSSTDPRKKACSKNLFTCLKLAQDIIKSSKSQAEAEVKYEKGEFKTPDDC